MWASSFEATKTLRTACATTLTRLSSARAQDPPFTTFGCKQQCAVVEIRTIALFPLENGDFVPDSKHINDL
jgi:hypothetical protein